jgi:hypothetical protein
MEIFSKVIGKMEKLLVKVYSIIKKSNQFMKEIGKTIYNTVKALKFGNQELNIQVIL